MATKSMFFISLLSMLVSLLACIFKIVSALPAIFFLISLVFYRESRSKKINQKVVLGEHNTIRMIFKSLSNEENYPEFSFKIGKVFYIVGCVKFSFDIFKFFIKLLVS